MTYKIRGFLKKIEDRVPYIPDFSDSWNILKLTIFSFFICFIFSFTSLSLISDFFQVFWHNLKSFIPYVTSQIFLLILFSKVINKIKPSISVLFIVFLNFLAIYLTSALFNKSFTGFFLDWDVMLMKLSVSWGLLFFFLMYFDWREKNLHPAHTLARLSYLQSKMRPHFLFNTLNSIMSLIKKEPDLAKKMLLNLSEILRASLKENNQNQTCTILEEVNLCKKYLEIEHIRLGERLSISWHVDSSIENAILPRMSIQPLIENSILHGIQLLEKGHIDIKITQNLLNRIYIEIKNEKPLSNKKGDNHNNISMKNLEDRLNLVFDYSVSFQKLDLGNIYYIKIDIPKIFN